MKVAHKIILMPALAVVALVFVFAVVQLTRSANEGLDHQIETGYLPAVVMGYELDQLLAELQRGLQDAVASADAGLLSETDKLRDRFTEIVELAERNETFAGSQVDALGEDFEAYYVLARQTSLRLIDMEMGADLQDALGETVDRYNKLRETVKEIIAASNDNITEAFERARTNQTRATVIYLAVVIVSIGALAALSFSVVRSILSSLNRVMAVAAEVAEGELTRRVEIVGDDELGTMGASINRALDRMRDAVGGFGTTAERLADASDELSGISLQMSGGAEANSDRAVMASGAAEQVSASVESVATGIEEMTASIREISRSSQEAARVASDAVESAQQTNEVIGRLAERSNEIRGVAKVISEIAEQTNLLALNATIEAARAGESGRGFAVVADEVKELARGTASATEDISTRMLSVEEDIRQAVEAIGSIAGVVDRIAEIQTGIALAVEEQTATASEISRSINEASHGTSEIAEHAAEVAQSAQTTVEGAAATNQSADNLSRMAEELKALVAEFRYRG